jgi:hypothetical protein
MYGESCFFGKATTFLPRREFISATRCWLVTAALLTAALPTAAFLTALLSTALLAATLLTTLLPAVLLAALLAATLLTTLLSAALLAALLASALLTIVFLVCHFASPYNMVNCPDRGHLIRAHAQGFGFIDCARQKQSTELRQLFQPNRNLT